MNNFILKKYIQNLTKDDIYKLAFKQNIILNSEETQKVYKYIKNNYQKYINNILSSEQILNDSKLILSNNNYNKLLNLYNEYKDKI